MKLSLRGQGVLSHGLVALGPMALSQNIVLYLPDLEKYGNIKSWTVSI